MLAPWRVARWSLQGGAILSSEDNIFLFKKKTFLGFFYKKCKQSGQMGALSNFFSSRLKAIKCAGMFLYTDSYISSLYTWLKRFLSSMVLNNERYSFSVIIDDWNKLL